MRFDKTCEHEMQSRAQSAERAFSLFTRGCLILAQLLDTQSHAIRNGQEDSSL